MIKTIIGSMAIIPEKRIKINAIEDIESYFEDNFGDYCVFSVAELIGEKNCTNLYFVIWYGVRDAETGISWGVSAVNGSILDIEDVLME